MGRAAAIASIGSGRACMADPTPTGAAALRELQEECGKIQVSAMQYEGSFRVDDWRYKNEEDKIITTLFSTTYQSGEPHGADDIAEVKWFSLEQLAEMMRKNETTETHDPLFTCLLNKYNQ